MTRVINIASGKGGVGKTTLTTNLAYALAKMGQDVTVVDTNLTTPNLGIHLGLYLAPNNLQGVLKGDTNLKDAIYPHTFGFKVIPAGLGIDSLIGVDPSRLYEVLSGLFGKTDYVILDSAPGLGREAISSINACEEVLIVTNPDLPSIIDALKVSRIAINTGKKIIGVVVNRRNKRRDEFSSNRIENILGIPILAEIPEDKNIPKSIMLKRPVLEVFPNSPSSIEIKRLAFKILGIEGGSEFRGKLGLLGRMVKWITG
ncbi:MAG: cell division ATPase MinD [Candidatus Aenigmatarchaeota archaeon]